MGHVDEDPHETQISAVDLFCGAGGLSFGMQRAGVAIAAGIDIDSVCRHPFETNVKAPFLEIDVAELLPSDVASLWYDGAIRVLAGCAPCQPFSTYAQGKNRGYQPMAVAEEVRRHRKRASPRNRHYGECPASRLPPCL